MGSLSETTLSKRAPLELNPLLTIHAEEQKTLYRDLVEISCLKIPINLLDNINFTAFGLGSISTTSLPQLELVRILNLYIQLADNKFYIIFPEITVEEVATTDQASTLFVVSNMKIEKGDLLEQLLIRCLTFRFKSIGLQKKSFTIF